MRSMLWSASKLAAVVISTALTIGVTVAAGGQTAEAVDTAQTADSSAAPKHTYLVNSDFEAYRNKSFDSGGKSYLYYNHYNTIGEEGGTGYGVASCDPSITESTNCRFPGFDPDKFGWKSSQKWDYYQIGDWYGRPVMAYGSPDNEVKGDPAGDAVEVNWERRADGTVNTFAELAAEEPGTSIYQDIDVTPGQRVSWSLDHASIAKDV